MVFSVYTKQMFSTDSTTDSTAAFGTIGGAEMQYFTVCLCKVQQLYK